MATIHSVKVGDTTYEVFDKASFQLSDLNSSRLTSIPSNSDLNNYTTPGTYYTTSSAVSNTIAHTPGSAAGFKLIVNAASSSNYVQQYILYNSSNPTASSNNIWIRYLDLSNNKQTDWQRIALMSQIPSISVSETALVINN